MFKKFILKWLFGEEDYYDIMRFKTYIKNEISEERSQHKKMHNLEMDVLMELIPNYYPIYLEFQKLGSLQEWKEKHYKYHWVGFCQQEGYLEADDQDYYSTRKEQIQARIARLIANVSKEEL